MLHIFLSNSENSNYGTTGKPVPGYEVTLLDENNYPVKQGEIGELKSKGRLLLLNIGEMLRRQKKHLLVNIRYSR